MTKLPANPQTNAEDRSTSTERTTQPKPTTTSAANPAPVEAAAPSESQKARQTPDQEAALESLDITSTRMMPVPEPLWEPLPPEAHEEPRTERRRGLPTLALMCVVAVVSFVAGGVTARMSAQMPLVFPQKDEPVENTASFVQEPEQEVQEAAPVAEEPEQEEPETQVYTYDNGSDTGYDTTDDTPATPDAPQTTHRWDFDSEGDRFLTYDDENGRVTVDYDDYTFSFDVDDLLVDEGETDEQKQVQKNDTSWDYYFSPSEPTSNRTREYGYGTGYDTDSDRDLYGWTRIF